MRACRAHRETPARVMLMGWLLVRDRSFDDSRNIA
jgi:hypothetical protein